MSVSRIDLLNHSFSKSLRGYATEEVDRLMQEAADTIGRLSEEKAALAGQVAQLEARLAEFRERESTLRDTLMTTQRVTADLKASAQREAQLIIDAAHSKAENLINQGQLRLARIQEDIAEARKVKAQFEMKVRAVVEQHLRMLDMSREDDEALEAAAARIAGRQKGGPA
ncbi:DivIVA domain-containing protein [Nitratidesulfovibrio sp. HK-II]|uniref:DivIVA domain-containing protein n=1 Tax=Nitratidesulfovibrio sp. HK-II TaxID=2009266 RepID=UPI000E2EC4F4|nr:DivIVA domain-containing protein [Nitratidesulfovibrio sp. HK-II]GBO96197.1 cell division initiation protein DivIVA [Nitratidesulfovibrio sp. HK-II]